VGVITGKLASCNDEADDIERKGNHEAGSNSAMLSKQTRH
jgi:hypothetical protein